MEIERINQVENIFASSDDEKTEKFEYYLVLFPDNITSLKLLVDNFSQFFSIVKSQDKFKREIHKNLSLLICIKTDSLVLTDEARNLIFNIEESPFYFKRYVITYTDLQVDLLSSAIVMNRLADQDLLGFFQNSLNEIDAFRTFKSNPAQETAYSLLIKLFIKLPFMNYRVISNQELTHINEEIERELNNKGLKELLETVLTIPTLDEISEEDFLLRLGVYDE